MTNIPYIKVYTHDTINTVHKLNWSTICELKITVTANEIKWIAHKYCRNVKINVQFQGTYLYLIILYEKYYSDR